MNPSKTLSIVILLCLLTMGVSVLYGIKVGTGMMEGVNYIKESAYKDKQTIGSY